MIEKVPQPEQRESKLALIERDLMEILRAGSKALPAVSGRKFFWLEQAPNEQLPSLSVESANERKVLLDPEHMPKGYAGKIQSIAPSPEGNLIAIRLSPDGTDWGSVEILDVNRPDRFLRNDRIPAEYCPTIMDVAGGGIPWIKVFEWGPDGFWVVRRETSIPRIDAATVWKKYPFSLYFHKYCQPMEEDVKLVVADDLQKFDMPTRIERAGNRLFVNISYNSKGGSDVEQPYMADISGSTEPQFVKIPMDGNGHHLVRPAGDQLYIWSSVGSPRGRIEKVPLNRVMEGPSAWESVVPEHSERVIENFLPVGDRIIVQWSFVGAGGVSIYDLRGSFEDIPIPIGEVKGVTYYQHGNSLLIHSLGPFSPSKIFEYKLDSKELSVREAVNIDGLREDEYEINLRFIPSHDGVQVPIYEMGKKNLPLSALTVIEVYGFQLKLSPGFRSMRSVAMKHGIRWVLACVRGGGELGQTWYKAGTGRNRPNTHKDLVAVARALEAEGRGKSIAYGGSYGGLVVLSAVNENPDAFKAILSQTPVIDGVTFAGTNKVDQGNPDDPEDLKIIKSWSPKHSIKLNAQYPPIRFDVSIGDDRVGNLPAVEEYMRDLQSQAVGNFSLVKRPGGHYGAANTLGYAKQTADQILWMLEQG